MKKHTFLSKFLRHPAAVSAVYILLNLLTSQLGQFSRRFAAVIAVDILSTKVL